VSFQPLAPLEPALEDTKSQKRNRESQLSSQARQTLSRKPPIAPRLAHIRHPLVAFTLGIALVAADLTLAIRPIVSVTFTLLQAALMVPWMAALVIGEHRHDPHREASQASGAQRAILTGGPLALLLVCTAAKWSVLREAAGTGLDVYIPLYRTYTGLNLLLFIVGLIGARRAERFLMVMADHPARLMILSFGLTTLIGGCLLTLPLSLRNITDASLVDGLFTATSAVCVTGLAVNNVAQTYTPFGQIIIFLLFQGGGLGIMVLSAFFAIVAGRRMRVRSAVVMAEMIDHESLASFRGKVASIVVSTLVLEAIGAFALYQGFIAYPEIGYGPGDEALSGPAGHVWAAIFHSVSAFCNAGFSIFKDGMMPFAGSLLVSSTIMALIILGGIGFPVIDEVLRAAVVRLLGRRPPRLSLHTRSVLLTTAILIGGGALAYLALEWSNTMSGLSIQARILTALFQSVTTRTAGFNTLDFGAMRGATLMVTCMLMFIGGSPGSTAGGIKTTTLAVLFASLRAELRGYEAPRLLQRSIPAATVRRATGLTFLSVVILSAILFALLLTEKHGPMQIAFETFSAFATVGLSTGITPELSVAGKLIVSAAMFIGRIGPLTLGLALASKAASRSYTLPEERVAIG